MSVGLLAPAAAQAATDLTAASTVFVNALEAAVSTFRTAKLDDHARTVERIREHARLFHGQLDAIAGRLTSAVGEI